MARTKAKTTYGGAMSRADAHSVASAIKNRVGAGMDELDAEKQQREYQQYLISKAVNPDVDSKYDLATYDASQKAGYQELPDQLKNDLTELNKVNQVDDPTGMQNVNQFDVQIADEDSGLQNLNPFTLAKNIKKAFDAKDEAEQNVMDKYGINSSYDLNTLKSLNNDANNASELENSRQQIINQYGIKDANYGKKDETSTARNYLQEIEYANNYLSERSDDPDTLRKDVTAYLNADDAANEAEAGVSAESMSGNTAAADQAQYLRYNADNKARELMDKYGYKDEKEFKKLAQYVQELNDYDARQAQQQEAYNNVHTGSTAKNIAGGVANSVNSLAANVLSGAGGMLETIDYAQGQKGTGGSYYDADSPLNASSQAMNYANATSDYQSATQQAISDKNKVLGMVYGAGMSAMQSAETSVLGGLGGESQALTRALSLAPFAANAYSSALSEGVSSGKDMGDAIESAVISAAIETGTEIYSADKFWDIIKSGSRTARKVAIDYAVSSLIEGSEEMVGDIVERLIDDARYGDESDYNTSVKEYMANGDSEEEARKKANHDWIMQFVEDGITGALSGAMGGGIATAVNVASNSAAAEEAFKNYTPEQYAELADRMNVNNSRGTGIRSDENDINEGDDTGWRTGDEVSYDYVGGNEGRSFVSEEAEKSAITAKNLAERYATQDKVSHAEKMDLWHAMQDSDNLEAEARIEKAKEDEKAAKKAAKAQKEWQAHESKVDAYNEAHGIATEEQSADQSIRYAIPEELRANETDATAGEVHTAMARSQSFDELVDAYTTGVNSTDANTRKQTVANLNNLTSMLEGKGIATEEQIQALKNTDADIYKAGYTGEEIATATNRQQQIYNAGQQAAIQARSDNNLAQRELMTQNSATINTDKGKSIYTDGFQTGMNANAYDRIMKTTDTAGYNGMSMDDLRERVSADMSIVGGDESALNTTMEQAYKYAQDRAINDAIKDAERVIMERNGIKEFGRGEVIDRRSDTSVALPEMRMIENLAQWTGLNIVIGNTDLVGEGNQGEFKASKSAIYLNVDTRGQLAGTAIHETVEFTDVFAHEDLAVVVKAFNDALIKSLGTAKYTRLLNTYAQKYSDEEGKTTADLQKEILADMAPVILGNEKSMRQFLQEIEANSTPEQAKTIKQKIADWLKDLADTLRDFLSEFKPTSYQRQVAEANIENIEELRSALIKSMATAVRNYQQAQMTELAEVLNVNENTDTVVDEVETVQDAYQIAYNNFADAVNNIATSEADNISAGNKISDEALTTLIDTANAFDLVSSSMDSGEIQAVNDFINSAIDDLVPDALQNKKAHNAVSNNTEIYSGAGFEDIPYNENNLLVEYEHHRMNGTPLQNRRMRRNGRKDPVNLETPAGKAMVTLTGTINQFEQKYGLSDSTVKGLLRDAKRAVNNIEQAIEEGRAGVDSKDGVVAIAGENYAQAMEELKDYAKDNIKGFDAKDINAVSYQAAIDHLRDYMNGRSYVNPVETSAENAELIDWLVENDQKNRYAVPYARNSKVIEDTTGMELTMSDDGSYATDQDGRQMPIVTVRYTGSDITKDEVSVKRAIKNELLRLKGTSTTIKSSGQVVGFDTKFAKEFPYSRHNRRMNEETRGIKYSAAINVKEIVENATNRRWVANTSIGHRNDAARGWDYYDVDFIVSDGARLLHYSGLLNVRGDANGKDFVYDISDTNWTGAQFIGSANADSVADNSPVQNYSIASENAERNQDNARRSRIIEDTSWQPLSEGQQAFYADESPLLLEDGKLKRYYHGTARKDRVGTVFRKDRATAGPMAYFTDSKTIAQSYSTDKSDTSIAYTDERYDSYATQFRLNVKGQDLSVEDAWRKLPASKRNEIMRKAPHVTLDWDADTPIYDANVKNGIGDFDNYLINSNGGNYLAALRESWLDSGTLYRHEDKYLDVLKMVGVEDATYLDPDYRDEGVYEVYLHITNPLDTTDIPQNVIDALQAASKNTDFDPMQSMGVDHWDKHSLSPDEFMRKIYSDAEYGASGAWTTIPDWVTDTLKNLGYDGIVDRGGKTGGFDHQVVIPFESNQVKNIDNLNPTENEDIRRSRIIEDVNGNTLTVSEEPAASVANHDYTYKTLTESDPITVYHPSVFGLEQFDIGSMVGADANEIREAIAAMSHRNIKKFNQEHGFGGSDHRLYNNDIGAFVAMTDKGLRHGLQRGGQLGVDGIDPVNIPAYFLNAKVVNEIGPDDRHPHPAYILMGAFYDENSKDLIHITRAVVSIYQDHFALEDMNEILLGVKHNKQRDIKTNKKEDVSHLSAVELPNRELRLTSSKITVQQLLDVCQENYPNSLSRDVAANLGYVIDKPDFPGQRFSRVIEDSNSDALTTGQREYFKDSKAIDENGRLKVMYHGSGYGGFKVFNSRFSDDGISFFFTDNPEIAASYSGTHDMYAPTINDAEESESIKDSSASINYQVYLNLKNPLVIDAGGAQWNAIHRHDSQFAKDVARLSELMTSTFETDYDYSIDVIVNDLLSGSDDFDAVISDNLRWKDDPAEYVKSRQKSFDELWEIASRLNKNIDWIRSDYLYTDDILRAFETGDIYVTTRVLAKEAKENGNDGVIINNLVDPGPNSDWYEAPSTVMIAFNSNQVKSINNENPTEDVDIRRSMNLDDNRNMNNEEISANRDEVASILEQGAEALKGTKVNKQAVQNIAMEMKRKYGSAIDLDTFTGNLTKLFGYLHNGKSINYNDFVAVMQDVARPAIDAAYTTQASREDYAQFRNAIDGMTFSLNMEQRKAISNAFGSMKVFQKYYPEIHIDSEAQSISDQWSTLVDISRGLLDENVLASDMPTALVDAMEALRPSMNNWEDNTQAAHDMALDIIGKYLGNYHDEGANKAVINEFTKTAEKQIKASQKEWQSKIKADYNERLKAERAYQKEIAADRVAKANERSAEQIARLRAKNATRVGDILERQKRNAQLRQINNSASKLYDALVNPSDANHVPKDVQEPVLELMASLDMSQPTIRQGEDGKWHTKILAERALTDTGRYSYEWQEITADTRDDALRQYNEALANGLGSQGARKWYDRMQKIADLYNKQDKVRGVDEQASQDMNEFLQGLDEELADEFDRIIKKGRDTGKASMADLDSDDLKVVNKVLKNVQHAINQINRSYSIPSVEISELASGTIRHSELSRGRVNHKKLRFINSIGDFLMLDNATMETYLHSIGADGLTQTLLNGQDTKARLIRESQEYAASVLGSIDQDTIKSWEKDVVDYGGIKLTKAQVMSLYELMKREDATSHRAGGFKADAEDVATSYLTDEELGEIVGSLTNEEKRVADALQHFLANNCAAWGNETSNILLGYDKFGDPHYFPMKVDKASVNANVGELLGGLTNSIRNMGMTKAVQEGANNALILDGIFDVYAQHVSDMATYSAWAAPVQDLIRFYNYKDVVEENGFVIRTTTKDAIKKLMGSNGTTYFTKMVSSIQQREQSSFVGGGMVEFLTGSAKKAAVMGNIRVVVQQPTAIFRAGKMIDYRYLNKGMAGVNEDLRKKMIDTSDVYWLKNQGNIDGYITQSLKSQITGIQGFSDKVSDWTGKLASKADQITWDAMYRAVIAEQIDELGKDKVGTDEFQNAVNKRFENIMLRTQVYDGTITRSQFMRSPDWLNKMQSAFMAEPVKTYNIVLRDAIDYLQSDSKDGRAKAMKELGRSAVVLLITNAVNAAVQSVWDAVRNAGDPDEEDNDFLTRMLAAFGINLNAESTTDQITAFLEGNFIDNVNMLNNIPIISDYADDVGSTIGELFFGQSSYGSSSSDLSMSGIEHLGDALKAIIKPGEKQTSYGTFTKIARAFSDISGYPVYAIQRDLAGVYNVIAHDVAPALGVDDMPLLQKQTKNTKQRQAKLDVYDTVLETTDLAEAQAAIDAAVESGNTYDSVNDGFKSSVLPTLQELYSTDRSEATKMINRLAELKAYCAEQDGSLKSYKTHSEKVEHYKKAIKEWLE